MMIHIYFATVHKQRSMIPLKKKTQHDEEPQRILCIHSSIAFRYLYLAIQRFLFIDKIGISIDTVDLDFVMELAVMR